MSHPGNGADPGDGGVPRARVRAREVGPRAWPPTPPSADVTAGMTPGATGVPSGTAGTSPGADPVIGPAPRSRPRPDQPLRARWDPTDDSGRQRVDREAHPERKKQSALGRFVSTYGWRAYAIPVLIVLTILLIIMTIRDGHDTAFVPAAEVTPDSARNTDVSKETKPIGAPTGDIKSAELPGGALPVGGPYTIRGQETYHVVPGVTKQVGAGGQLYTYTVEVENGLNPTDYGSDRAFGKMVDATLANPRSWIGGGKVAFRRIDSGEPDLRITLASTHTAKELCGYQIQLETSCFYPPEGRVTLNEARWVRGALAFQGDDVAYRQYLVNHETGHGIGYDHHEPCEKNGALAPIMMQQSFGVANSQIMALDPDMQANRTYVCHANPWPYPDK